MLVMDESNSKVDFKHSKFFPFLTAIHYFSDLYVHLRVML